MEPAVLARGLETFTGVSRRFERRGENATHVLVDDYAHHPTELKAAIEAARQTYPGKKITGIFQPHLYSRTRDFMEGFAEALSALDTCIIMPIYPAREQPIPGITSDALMALIQTKKTLLTATQILENPAEIFPSGVVLVLGAGDIDRIVEPLQNALFHA